MREVTHHRNARTPDFHDLITVTTAGDTALPTSYHVRAALAPGAVLELADLRFQDKCVATPKDVNGLTNEVLLAVLLDRLGQFQRGPMASVENEDALNHLHRALAALQARTCRRVDQGVAGTQVGHAVPRITREAFLFSVGGLLFDRADHKRGAELTEALRALLPLSAYERQQVEGCDRPWVADALRRAEAGAVGKLTTLLEEDVVEKTATARVQVHDGRLVVGGEVVALTGDLVGRWAAWSDVERAFKKLRPPATAAELAVLDGLATTAAARNGLAELRSALTRAAP